MWCGGINTDQGVWEDRIADQSEPRDVSPALQSPLHQWWTATLAVPAPCPPLPPVDCGEGMRSCPGETDPMGCPMPEICIAEGDSCPFFCPHVEHPNCGTVLSYCAGPVDAMGCEGPMTCVMVDWAAGEDCPPA